jgi:hypothetical protein
MRNPDLVTIAEAERALGIGPRVLRMLDTRRRERPGAAIDMPEPVVEGASVRLWSLAELREWWPRRVDGRKAR